MRAIAIAALLLSWAPPAEATYSILAVDTATGEVGGAGTSCVGGLNVAIIYGSVPGVGVVHAQAYINEQGRDRAVELLGMGETPADIILDITSPQFDPNASVRQYAVATIDTAIANHTGADNGVWAGHHTGLVDRFAYSAQGNILTGEDVVSNASAGFAGNGCDLAERLMLALEAGAQNGGGDSRCTPGGIPSDSAFIRVDRPGDAEWLYLHVEDTGPLSPLPMLREQFDQWRATHACTEPPPPPDAGMIDTGGIDTGTPDAGEDPRDASQIADASPYDALDGFTPPLTEDEGCGCTTAPKSSGGPAIALLALVLVSMRLRRR